MPNEFHTHSYSGMTSIAGGHNHQYSGRTDSDPNTMRHTHIMEGYTTTNDGHRHLYRIQTGPAISWNDSHHHSYQGNTDIAQMHIHGMNGYTTIAQ